MIFRVFDAPSEIQARPNRTSPRRRGYVTIPGPFHWSWKPLPQLHFKFYNDFARQRSFDGPTNEVFVS